MTRWRANGDVLDHEFIGEVVEVAYGGLIDKFPFGMVMQKGLTVRTG